MTTENEPQAAGNLPEFLTNPDMAGELFRQVMLAKADDPDDPHDRDYYEDCCEVYAGMCNFPNGFLRLPITIGRRRCDADNPNEYELFAWIYYSMKRGLDLTDAVKRAIESILVGAELKRLVYEPDPADYSAAEEWCDDLTAEGVPPHVAETLALDIVRVLQQLEWLERDEFFGIDDFERAQEIRERHGFPPLDESALVI